MKVTAMSTVSCGCCSAGCVCGNHQDVPRGIHPQACAYHADPAHPHPRVTSPPAERVTSAMGLFLFSGYNGR